MKSITNLRAAAVAGGGCSACSRVRHGHGSSSDPIYSRYQAMKQRCMNPRHKSYPDYGGRGIKVCPRWLNSFKSFLEDMGPLPSEDHSIERGDGDVGYEPGNCYWATKAEQALNQSSNVEVVIDGLSFSTLAAACRHFNVVSYGTARMRVNQYGWSPALAATTPTKGKK